MSVGAAVRVCFVKFEVSLVPFINYLQQSAFLYMLLSLLSHALVRVVQELPAPAWPNIRCTCISYQLTT